MLRLPCGLCVPEGACANALPAVAENAHIKTANNLRTSLDPNMTASCFMPDSKHETELDMNALGAIHCPEWLPGARGETAAAREGLLGMAHTPDRSPYELGVKV